MMDKTENTLREALRQLEEANDALAALRTNEQYLEMLALGQQDALWALDNARSFARAALASHPPSDGLVEALRECADKLWVLRCNSRDPKDREVAEKACDMAFAALKDTSNGG